MENEKSNWFDKNWLVILLCVVFFPVGLYGLWKSSSFKMLWKVVITSLIAIIIIANIGDDKSVSSSTSKKEVPTDSVKAEVITNWVYSQDSDKMTSNKQYFAECKSTNEIEFQAPYSGGSYFTITVRNMENKNDVCISVSKGQFMTSVMGSESMKVKFDNDSPVSFTFNSAADGSADIIFLNQSKKFISRLKTAKKVIIETMFFQEGNKQLEFDVDGLKWNH